MMQTIEAIIDTQGRVSLLESVKLTRKHRAIVTILNDEKVAEKDFDQPAKRPLKTGFNISKSKIELNYQPISFDEGLKKTFAN